MALSNWDTLAINNQGKSCDGEFKVGGNSIDIYKNWVYIRSKGMWRKDSSSFVEPTIAEISNGNIQLAGFDIRAIRGSQNAIFVFTSYSYLTPTKKYKRKYFAGIGCYGYYSKVAEYLKWKGIDVEYDDYCTGSSNYDKKTGKTLKGAWAQHINLSKDGEYIKIDGDIDITIEKEFIDKYGEFTDWVGVMPSTLKEFKDWLWNDIVHEYKYANEDEKKWFKKIDWDELIRFNQGDAFFGGAINTGTKVDEVDEPVINKMIKGLGGKK